MGKAETNKNQKQQLLVILFYSLYLPLLVYLYSLWKHHKFLLTDTDKLINLHILLNNNNDNKTSHILTTLRNHWVDTLGVIYHPRGFKLPLCKHTLYIETWQAPREWLRSTFIAELWPNTLK